MDGVVQLEIGGTIELDGDQLAAGQFDIGQGIFAELLDDREGAGEMRRLGTGQFKMFRPHANGSHFGQSGVAQS
ncbi:hypothetical protein D3C72_2460670 [compost metagenome]